MVRDFQRSEVVEPGDLFSALPAVLRDSVLIGGVGEGGGGQGWGQGARELVAQRSVEDPSCRVRVSKYCLRR